MATSDRKGLCTVDVHCDDVFSNLLWLMRPSICLHPMQLTNSSNTNWNMGRRTRPKRMHKLLLLRSPRTIWLLIHLPSHNVGVICVHVLTASGSLDTLFRKTKVFLCVNVYSNLQATPFIFWKPLDDAVVATRVLKRTGSR